MDILIAMLMINIISLNFPTLIYVEENIYYASPMEQLDIVNPIVIR